MNVRGSTRTINKRSSNCSIWPEEKNLRLIDWGNQRVRRVLNDRKCEQQDLKIMPKVRERKQTNELYDQSSRERTNREEWIHPNPHTLLFVNAWKRIAESRFPLEKNNLPNENEKTRTKPFPNDQIVRWEWEKHCDISIIRMARTELQKQSTGACWGCTISRIHRDVEKHCVEGLRQTLISINALKNVCEKKRRVKGVRRLYPQKESSMIYLWKPPQNSFWRHVKTNYLEYPFLWLQELK